MKFSRAPLLALFPILAYTQPATSQMPAVTVYSARVANQAPSATFAMPVSSLRYEPLVDLQTRNLAEGQADVTLRGGIFENTGFRIGAVTLSDPQTGHYFAELPIAPAMLGAPTILTGADLAAVTNATVGAVAFAWRPIQTAGSAAVGVGDHALRRSELYQGATKAAEAGGGRLGGDVGIAYSKSNGARPYGEHEFNRLNGRLQWSAGKSQTDLFAGYQAKRFGWPNMYTPFNSNETENLQTVLLLLNERVQTDADGFVEFGAYHRRNKDDYAFNRFAPLGAVHPFQHTTWVSGAAAAARHDFGSFALQARGEILADDLRSTSLTFGRYHTRTLTKFSLIPEKTWAANDGSRTTLKAGASFDDSNRDAGAVSPAIELAHAYPSSALRRTFLSYAQSSQLPTYTALNSSPAAGLFRGNPNLGREKSRALEVGASGALAGWSVDGALFWRRDDALVDWTYRRGVTARTANAVDVDVAGAELVARRSWSHCDVVLGYTVLTKDADYRGATVDASFYALNYARHRLTAAFTCRLGAGFELRVDNALRMQADNALRPVGGDEALVTSLGLAWHPPRLPGLEFTLSVDNLWNSNFQDVPAVPAARRAIAFGAGYTW